MATLETKNVTLVCFAGSGGTGKTTLVNEIYKRVVDDNDVPYMGKVKIHKSVVRDFYKLWRVADEAAYHALMSPVRLRFQMELFDYYLDKLRECVRKAEDGTTVLCERSAFDHFAYVLYGAREMLTPMAMKHLRGCLDTFMALQPHVFYLPYPTPWDDQGSDGFRAREPAKDTLVDAMIFKLLHELDYSHALAGALPRIGLNERYEEFLVAFKHHTLVSNPYVRKVPR